MSETPRHGGAREGAGAPSGPRQPPSEDKQDFDHWRARSERAKALQAELDLGVAEGRLVNRDSVQAASATLLAVFTQHCRGIGDTLERTLGLAPEAAAAISTEIDEALSVLADDLKKMANG